jgi:hypothetical protein
MASDSVLREQLLALLKGGNAHMTFDEAVAEFPLEAINRRPLNVPYTPWHLLEHLRITQWDILEFIRNPEHISPKWPKGYWPSQKEQADELRWFETISNFNADLSDLEELVLNPATRLEGPITHAPGYTILREVQLASDHNAYHVGEFAILRQVMGTWPATRAGN